MEGWESSISHELFSGSSADYFSCLKTEERGGFQAESTQEEETWETAVLVVRKKVKRRLEWLRREKRETCVTH
ncbi:hypothetical protein SUGI_0238560 [Cryptomeria japonica]|nr:hypothetical protein SUGI_0238560 [Cryptomeria japonica]